MCMKTLLYAACLFNADSLTYSILKVNPKLLLTHPIKCSSAEEVNSNIMVRNCLDGNTKWEKVRDVQVVK